MSFKREDYNGIKEKYYLRVVERTTKTGIKLRHLTRTFKYETGEVVYGKEDEFAPTTTYKIIAIDEQVEKIVRNYCKDKEQFDIDKLNRIISNALSEK